MGRIVQRAVALAATALIAGVGVAAATVPTAGAAEEEGVSVLRVGVPNDLTTANPFSLRSGSDWNVATIQYDMMLQFGSEDLSPQPGLAEECQPNDDFTEWTCTFRDDVTWSDGEPFTARDVAFTYELVIDAPISTYDNYFTEGTTFETPDDTTLIWKSKTPTSQPLTPPWVYIVPEHVWGQYADLDKAELRAVEKRSFGDNGPLSSDRGQPRAELDAREEPQLLGSEPTSMRSGFSCTRIRTRWRKH